MTILYVGKKHAYRDEISMARAESARVAVQAPRAETLDRDPKLVFRVTTEDKAYYTTDNIEVLRMVGENPACRVKVLSVA